VAIGTVYAFSFVDAIAVDGDSEKAKQIVFLGVNVAAVAISKHAFFKQTSTNVRSSHIRCCAFLSNRCL